MAKNKVMTPRKLICNLLGKDEGGFNSHDMDEEIQVCMMSTKDEEAFVHFRISSVDENTIYISPRGISSNKERFTAKLPECELTVGFIKHMERKANGQ